MKNKAKLIATLKGTRRNRCTNLRTSRILAQRSKLSISRKPQQPLWTNTIQRNPQMSSLRREPKQEPHFRSLNPFSNTQKLNNPSVAQDLIRKQVETTRRILTKENQSVNLILWVVTWQRQEAITVKITTPKEGCNRSLSPSTIRATKAILSNMELSRREVTSGRLPPSLLPPILLKKVLLITTMKRGSTLEETAISWYRTN